jgi:hypothetical protein
VESAAAAADKTNDSRSRGTKRQQDKPEEQQETSAAASKKPRRGAAASEPPAQETSSKDKAAEAKDKKRTRAGQTDSKADSEPAAAGSSKRNTKDAGSAGKGAAAPEGKELVGCRIKVWWTDDKKFYPGEVTVSASQPHPARHPQRRLYGFASCNGWPQARLNMPACARSFRRSAVSCMLRR